MSGVEGSPFAGWRGMLQAMMRYLPACGVLVLSKDKARARPVRGRGAGRPRVVSDSLDVSRSSWIESAVFQAEVGDDTGMLVVQIGGRKITYVDVPVAVWMSFKTAESPGSFYNDQIKQQYEREEGTPLWVKHDFALDAPVTAPVQCAFNEECEPVILRQLNAAERSVLVAAYAFTRSRIVSALASAHRRGVDVRVKVDAQQGDYPLARKQLAYLEKSGVPVQRIVMKGKYAAQHNKFLVVDDRYVITGSYNFTTTAGVANWENNVWMDAPEIAKRYAAAWAAIESE